MPRDRFLAETKKIGHPPWAGIHVAKLSNKFKVSKSAVALHMETR